jgi:hypothetical protein
MVIETDAEGGDKIVRGAKPEGENEGQAHEDPVDEPDVDLAIALGRRLHDMQPRAQSELNRLPRHRERTADDGLAGNDRGDGRQPDEGQLQ